VSRREPAPVAAINLSRGSYERASAFRHSPSVYVGLAAAFDRRDIVNTPRLRPMFSRRNVLPCTFLFLLVVAAAFGFRAAAAQSPAAAGGSVQRPPFQSDEEMKKDFNDDDLKEKNDKPAGKWGYSIDLDDKQINDASAPAYVSSIQLLSGGGKYQGIHKIKRVQVKNRSSRSIVLVQVRVEVIRFKEPEKVLLEDEFPFANAVIAPNSSEAVEVKTLYPPRLLKALARDGELSGHFVIMMSVQAVRFADGSFWRRPEQTALLRLPYLEQSQGRSILAQFMGNIMSIPPPDGA
jgi:hypothetical protein